MELASYEGDGPPPARQNAEGRRLIPGFNDAAVQFEHAVAFVQGPDAGKGDVQMLRGQFA